jgi:hypothetical protein
LARLVETSHIDNLREKEREELMKSRSTLHHVWTALLAVFTVIICSSSLANAYDDSAEEIGFWTVKGPNPSHTYFHTKLGVNPDTDLIAKRFNTTPEAIRADNPTKTLALCKFGNKFVMRDGIRDPKDRASDGIWTSL